MLTAITRAFRDLLAGRHELAEGLVVRRLVPVSVPIGNSVRIAVAIFSYLDTVSFGVTADYDSLPDLNVFVDGIRRGLTELSDPALG